MPYQSDDLSALSRADKGDGAKIGQIVQIDRMLTRSHAAIRSEICARTRELRSALGFTQEQMATALGISEEAYRKYEKRTPLPHHLMERFATLTRSSVEYIVTGSKTAPRRRII